MLVALSRHRALLVAIVLAAAAAGFAAPTLAWTHGDDHETSVEHQQYHSPALLQAHPLPMPARLGFFRPPDAAVSLTVVVASILKVPLTA